MPSVAEAVNAIRLRDVDIVGHRVVHGGERFLESVIIDDAVKAAINDLQRFAPLHNRLNLEGIETAQGKFPDAKHVAVFDTAFHRTIPEQAAVYPVPYEYYERDRVKRYGFHGVNIEYCTHRAASMLSGDVAKINLIVCHLGNGCSVTAVSNGQSIDNSMGFTPLEGLMMGTRSGSIDPGLVLRMVAEKNSDVEEVDRILNKRSGLLGISGISNDMREVVGSARYGDKRAALAISMFVYRLNIHIGMMAAQLSRLDGIVFTAGIGEHSSMIRSRACEALQILGCKIDSMRNDDAKGDAIISSADSTVPVIVITAREDWQIARECWGL